LITELYEGGKKMKWLNKKERNVIILTTVIWVSLLCFAFLIAENETSDLDLACKQCGYEEATGSKSKMNNERNHLKIKIECDGKYMIEQQEMKRKITTRNKWGESSSYWKWNERLVWCGERRNEQIILELE